MPLAMTDRHLSRPEGLRGMAGNIVMDNPLASPTTQMMYTGQFGNYDIASEVNAWYASQGGVPQLQESVGSSINYMGTSTPRVPLSTDSAGKWVREHVGLVLLGLGIAGFIALR